MNIAIIQPNFYNLKKFALTSIEWTIEDDMLTPTMKMKRKNNMSKFSSIYDELYDR